MTTDSAESRSTRQPKSHRRRRRTNREASSGGGGILTSLATASSDPTRSLDYYDELRKRAPFETDESSYVVKLTTAPIGEGGDGENADDAETSSYRMCSIASFLALSENGQRRAHSEDEAMGLAMGVYHFNNGISTVVPQLEGLSSRCNVRLTADIFDTRFSPIESVRTVMSDAVLGGERHTSATPQPCGLLGPWRSAVSQPLSTVALTVGEHRRGPIPVVSYAAASSELDNEGQYPLFGRTVTSVAGDARAVVSYLQTLNVKRVGMLFVTDVWGADYERAFVEAAGDAGMKVAAEAVNYAGLSSGEARAAVNRFKAEEYKYIFCAVYVAHFEAIMREAVLAGMAGRDAGTLWIYSQLDTNQFLEQSDYAPTDPLSDITSIAFFQLVGGTRKTPGRESHDRFIAEWSKIHDNADFTDYIRSKLPPEVSGIAANISFADEPKDEYSYFAYDVIIAYGLAACNVGDKNADIFFTSKELYSSFLRGEFDGASGPVRIEENTGSRDYHSAVYTIDNVLPHLSADDGRISFRIEPSMVFTMGGWVLRPDGQEFVYSDNTTIPPHPFPPLQHETILLNDWARIFGLVLCALSLALSLAFLSWTIVNRRTVVVKASQPFFLIMLCVGTFLMASAIIPMSVEHPTTAAACQAVPWLFSLGFITVFSALFTKTKQVNKIYFQQTRRCVSRVVVKPSHVLKPFLFLFIANLAVLISWTIISPLTSVYVPTNSVDHFGRYTQSYPACFPRNPSWQDLTFLLLVVSIDFCALVYAVFEAYRGRNIKTSFSESRYIAVSMVAMLQAFVIGIPVFIIANDSPTAWFVVRSCLVVITSVVILLPIFLPKMKYLKNICDRKEREEIRRRLRLKKEWQIQSLAYGDWEIEASGVHVGEVSPNFRYANSPNMKSAEDQAAAVESNIGVGVAIRCHGDGSLVASGDVSLTELGL